jgi:hypothetical protein
MRILPCLVLFAALPAAAQNVRTADRTALMFNLGGIMSSTPTALDGVGVGGRYFFQESLALRAALGLGFATDKQELGSQSSEDSTTTLALEGGLELVLMRAKSAYLYTGGLLQVGSTSVDPEGGSNNTEGFGVTLAGLLGASYFLMEGLSVGAEYRLGLQYGSETQEVGNDERERTTTFFGTGTVGFHLGFWF